MLCRTSACAVAAPVSNQRGRSLKHSILWARGHQRSRRDHAATCVCCGASASEKDIVSRFDNALPMMGLPCTLADAGLCVLPAAAAGLALDV